MITIDDFKNMELCVAKVLSAEPHPNADKLLLLKVAIDEKERQIVAGIRAWYAPETLVGKKIIIIRNLEPATIRGQESQGMLLAASHEGDLSVLTLDRDLPAGAKIS